MDNSEITIWVANQLFSRGLVSGSTGNISFREGEIIYISKSGSCFGTLNKDSFAKISINGEIMKGKPSKEWPMHVKLYQTQPHINGVIHTHSFFSTLFSCIEDLQKRINELFSYTPYLEMQTKRNIGIVPYAPPGSQKLFDAFKRQVIQNTNVYFLKNHGVVVSSESVMQAFFLLEEIEQTCKLHFYICSDKYVIKEKNMY